MSWDHIGLILVSCLFHAVWNVLTQTSRNAQFLSGLKGLWIMGLGAALIPFFELQALPGGLWLWIGMSGLLHGAYILSLSQAYNTTDISYVYPIARSAPVFVPAFAWFLLGERLGWASLLAIAIILLAVYMLHFQGQLLAGWRTLWNAVLHEDLRWSFITLGLVVAYSLVDKQGMVLFHRHSPDTALANGLMFFFLEAMVGFTLCNLFLFVRHPAGEILNVWSAERGKGLLAGLATVGSYGLICVVLQLEPVSQVVAVRQTSVLMVVLWGVLRLKEPFGTQRILAAGLTVLGVALIGWDKP